MAKLRTSTLKIGRVIHELTKDIVKTYPIIADKGATGDFATYKRISWGSQTNKDKIKEFIEEAVVEIVIASANYDRGVELAQAVKVRLEDSHSHREFETTKDEAINVSDIALINASEDWQSDFYLQILTFRFEASKR